MRTNHNEPELGIIEGGRSYPLPLFQRLSGLGTWGIRQARRDGLRVVKVGRRKFVLGSDWLTYLERQAANQAT